MGTVARQGRARLTTNHFLRGNRHSCKTGSNGQLPDGSDEGAAGGVGNARGKYSRSSVVEQTGSKPAARGFDSHREFSARQGSDNGDENRKRFCPVAALRH